MTNTDALIGVVGTTIAAGTALKVADKIVFMDNKKKKGKNKEGITLF